MILGFKEEGTEETEGDRSSPLRTEAESLRRKKHKAPWNILFCDGHAAAQKTSELRASDDASLSRWNNDHQPHRDLLQDW